MNRITLTVIIIALVFGVWFFFFNNSSDDVDDSGEDVMYAQATDREDEEQEPSPEPTPEPLLPADISSILDPRKSVPLDTIPQSITVLVNRAYLMPSDYVPEDLTVVNVPFDVTYISDKNKLRKAAAIAVKKLFTRAKKKGLDLVAVSGYRSYARQKQVYDESVLKDGKEHAERYCAVPGSSEHQTGLAIDISAECIDAELTVDFERTKEGEWTLKHAHKYGFIVRYPKGKAKITGYGYEPWHLRYVGVAVATYLYKNDLSLEEYYNVTMNQDEDKAFNDVEGV